MFVLVALDYLETQLEATTSHVTTTNVTLCYIQFNGITILTGFFFQFFPDPHNIHDMWRAVDDSFKKLGFSIRVLFVSDNPDETSSVPGCITCSISPLLFSKPDSYSIHVSSHKV